MCDAGGTIQEEEKKVEKRGTCLLPEKGKEGCRGNGRQRTNPIRHFFLFPATRQPGSHTVCTEQVGILISRSPAMHLPFFSPHPLGFSLFSPFLSPSLSFCIPPFTSPQNPSTVSIASQAEPHNLAAVPVPFEGKPCSLVLSLEAFAKPIPFFLHIFVIVPER